MKTNVTSSNVVLAIFSIHGLQGHADSTVEEPNIYTVFAESGKEWHAAIYRAYDSIHPVGLLISAALLIIQYTA